MDSLVRIWVAFGEPNPPLWRTKDEVVTAFALAAPSLAPPLGESDTGTGDPVISTKKHHRMNRAASSSPPYFKPVSYTHLTLPTTPYV